MDRGNEGLIGKVLKTARVAQWLGAGSAPKGGLSSLPSIYGGQHTRLLGSGGLSSSSDARHIRCVSVGTSNHLFVPLHRPTPLHIVKDMKI